jgi:hypothetical protein
MELQHVWNVKTEMLPGMARAMGALPESFRKCLSNIPGNYDLNELQKTAILGLHTYFGQY